MLGGPYCVPIGLATSKDNRVIYYATIVATSPRNKKLKFTPSSQIDTLESRVLTRCIVGENE